MNAYQPRNARCSRSTGLVVLLALSGLAAGGAGVAGEAAELAVTATATAIDVAAAAQGLAAAIDGEDDAFDRARSGCDAVAAALPALKSSMARLGDSPEAGAARRQLARVESAAGGWLRNCAAIDEARGEILALHDAAADVDARLPALQAQIDLAARQLAESGQPASQAYLVVRQMLLLERIRAGARRVLDAGPDAVAAADRLARDQAIFVQVLDGLLRGSPESSIQAVTDAVAREQLGQVREQFDGLGATLSQIGRGVVRVVEVRAAIDRQRPQEGELIAGLRALARSLLAIR